MVIHFFSSRFSMSFISITLHSLFLRFVGSVFLSHIRLRRMYDGLSNLFSVQVFAITGDWRVFFIAIFFKVRFVSFCFSLDETFPVCCVDYCSSVLLK